MKNKKLKLLCLVILGVQLLTSCRKNEFENPKVVKTDTNLVSTKVVRIEKFGPDDSTYFKIKYNENGALYQLMIDYHKNGMSYVSTRTFAYQNDLLSMVTLIDSNVYPANILNDKNQYEYKYDSNGRIINEIINGVDKFIYYDSVGRPNYMLHQNGDSTDVFYLNDGYLQFRTYDSLWIALKKKKDAGEITDDIGNEVNTYYGWRIDSGHLFYMNSHPGGGFSIDFFYSKIEKPLPDYVWNFVELTSAKPEIWLPSWTHSNYIESEVKYNSRYTPTYNFTFEKDTLGRLVGMHKTFTDGFGSLPQKTTFNFYY